MRVGFAGLGRMGRLMAANLVRAGHQVVVWNRTADKARALAAETGCTVADSPAALTSSCEVVVTMLADDRSSEAVHLAPDGLFSVPGAGVFVEMGTMSREHILDLGARSPDGARVIDAPVSGATHAARDARLLIMAGCTDVEAEPLMPVFRAMGDRTRCLGHLGAGAVMKLAVNAMLHGLNQSLAEALAMVEAAGIDRATAFDLIKSSAAGAPMLHYRRPLYLDEAAHDVTFTVALARKDMEVAVALAREFGVAMPQAKVTLATLQDAEAAGYAARDMASILTYIREKGT